MADKALIMTVKNIALVEGEYILTADVAVTQGEGAFTFEVEATSANFNPLIPTWRTRLKDAVVAKAAADYSVTVDDVLFTDCSLI